tara:strand:- start:423 stop:1280 length:858 start_codon:yes stop_codon:yes gene_type:complete
MSDVHVNNDKLKPVVKPLEQKKRKVATTPKVSDLKKSERIGLIFKILFGVAMISAAIVISLLVRTNYNTNFETQEYVKDMQEKSNEIIELNRKSLIAGLYSVNRVIEKEIPTRADRLEIFMRKAKGILLEHNQETDLTDEEINQMLKINFDLSEQYAMSPYIFMAFAAAESSFMKRAESPYGALGIVQFMPSTMKMVIGDAYIDNIEFNPVEACRAWYKYISILTEATDGDLKWTACAYLTQTAIEFKNTDRSIEDFMTWLTSFSENNPNYPYDIEELYESYTQE